SVQASRSPNGHISAAICLGLRPGHGVRRLRKNAVPVGSGALYGVAVLAGFRWSIGRALEDARLAPSAAREAVAQRMKADAHDRATGEAVHRDALACDGRGVREFDRPHDRLPFVVPNDFVACIVQRGDEYLQMIRVRIDASDDARG